MLRTPFYKLHQDHGAKFVDFNGWEMPMMYTSIHEEHRRVRESLGLFDVSHMARFKISGRHGRRLLERVLTRRVTDMAPKTCRYSLICNEQGGVMDDVLIYRFDEHWLMVANASNRQKIHDHLKTNINELNAKIEDQTESTAMVAVQGPQVMAYVSRFSKTIPQLKRYHFDVKNYMILKLTISRTGYTGEDGVEIILSATMAQTALKMLMGRSEEGGPELKPVGLGARDSLRLEAGMPLYGHELDEQTDPLSAGLGFAVTLDKDEHERGEPFIGQEALKKIAQQGPPQKRIGLKLQGKRTPRQGMDVLIGDTVVGRVTSGCLSPSLGYPIAMAYVAADSADQGHYRVQLGKQAADAEAVPMPFYKP